MPDSTGPASDPAGFGLYVHWPFCLAKCPYCDFNSHVRDAGTDITPFGDALVRELAWFAARTPERTLTSIFFGGGTPSLMPPNIVARVIDAAAGHWSFTDDIEITLEANPTSAEAENFRGYRTGGVNRVSLGAQALNDRDLKALGRRHSAREALAAHRMAAKIFPRTSFDLIYARPGQCTDDWRQELAQALGEQQGHMSLYQLTIEPGTAFFRWHAAGKLAIPDETAAADMYEVTQDLTTAAGLPAYEISNHAGPGMECRHNLVYWRYGEYAGIGPGAHSRLIGPDGRRIGLHTQALPQAWAQAVTRHGHAIMEETPLTRDQAGEEYAMMALRLAEGLDLSRYRAISGKTIDADRVAQLTAHRLVRSQEDGRLTATRNGRMVLDAIIRQLLDGG